MSQTRARKPTIVDVSEASGVSVATVSRILNGKPDVAPRTRERVLRVMDEIGFAPQRAWRQIRSGRSGLIAMHCPQDFNPPAHGVIMAAALGVEEAGYSINVITRDLSDAELLAIFRGREADGVILLEVLTDDRRAALLQEHGFPFVMIGHRQESSGMSYVDVDEQRAIDLAVDHLVDLGHQQIGLVNLDPVRGEKTYGYSVWAQEAYERACARLGLPVAAVVGGPSFETMARAARRLLEAQPGITALVALQDQAVIGLVKAARDLGLRVPEDLSIVGMANTAMSEMATPPLTSISFPEDDLGHVAARLLLARIDGGRAEAEQVLVGPRLTVRGSTAAPRPRGPGHE